MKCTLRALVFVLLIASISIPSGSYADSAPPLPSDGQSPSDFPDSAVPLGFQLSHPRWMTVAPGQSRAGFFYWRIADVCLSVDQKLPGRTEDRWLLRGEDSGREVALLIPNRVYSTSWRTVGFRFGLRRVDLPPGYRLRLAASREALDAAAPDARVTDFESSGSPFLLPATFEHRYLMVSRSALATAAPSGSTVGASPSVAERWALASSPILNPR